MQVSLDTNVWIFGILGQNSFCERILLNLDKFEIVIPGQVRAELERNLSDSDMKRLYQFVLGLADFCLGLWNLFPGCSIFYHFASAGCDVEQSDNNPGQGQGGDDLGSGDDGFDGCHIA